MQARQLQQDDAEQNHRDNRSTNFQTGLAAAVPHFRNRLQFVRNGFKTMPTIPDAWPAPVEVEDENSDINPLQRA